MGRPLSRSCAGFGLVDVVLGLSVLVIAVLGASGALSSSAMLGESTPELTRAQLGALRMIEELRAETLSSVFADHNELSGGAGFAVSGLEAPEGDPDGLAGRIEFPTPDGEPAALREDAIPADFGGPRDLDGDGAITGDDVAFTYAQLPVRVRVEWRGRNGARYVELETVLGGW